MSRSYYGSAPTLERPKVERRLNVGKLYQRLGYRPHPRQLDFHEAGAEFRFRVVDAGRRWGKSKAGPMDMIPRMLLKQPTLGWIVAPTYDLGEKEFRVFWNVLVEQMKVPVKKGKTFYNIRTKDFRIETVWGSSVEVRSAEHPDSLVGEGLDWVIMAEAAKLKLSHWEKYIRPALADKRGAAIFVSTPEGYNWFYDYWRRGQEAKFNNWWSIKSPSWDNIAMFPDGRDDPEFQDAEATSSEEVFMQEWGAEFTSFAGRIYSEFDEGYHGLSTDTWEFHPEWPNYVAFDFGFRNPFVCLQIQVAPNDDVIVWDEYYERNLHTSEHARRLKSIIDWRVDGAYYDPSGPDEIEEILNVWRDDSYNRNQYVSTIMAEPAPNDWRAGVNRVKEWLKLRPNPQDTSKQVPKLYVVTDNCPNTLREFNTYRVKEQSEKVSENKDPKEEPRKKDDHAMDALRYMVAGHFGLESHYGYVA